MLQEKALDSGRLIVWGVPLARSRSNLATSAVWVPALQQLVKYLAVPKDELPVRRLDTLHPQESDLKRLSSADRQTLSEKLPIAFASIDRLSEAIAQGQGSKDLTALLLMLTVFLGMVEVLLSNRMR